MRAPSQPSEVSSLIQTLLPFLPSVPLIYPPFISLSLYKSSFHCQHSPRLFYLHNNDLMRFNGEGLYRGRTLGDMWCVPADRQAYSWVRGQRNAASAAVCYVRHTRTVNMQTYEAAGQIKITAHFMEYIHKKAHLRNRAHANTCAQVKPFKQCVPTEC